MQTPLRVSYHGIDPSPTFDTAINERVDRLERLHDRITSCRVVVEVPGRAPETGKVAIAVKVEVLVPGRNTIVGTGEAQRQATRGDLSTAITEAFDAVERQLEKPIAPLAPEHGPHASTGQSGQVVRLYPAQRYGFVEVAGGPDLYFTENAVQGAAYDDLETGMIVLVTRATTEGPMGPQASSVRVLGGRRSPE